MGRFGEYCLRNIIVDINSYVFYNIPIPQGGV